MSKVFCLVLVFGDTGLPGLAWNFWTQNIFLLRVVVHIFISTRSSRGSQILEFKAILVRIGFQASQPGRHKTMPQKSQNQTLRFSVSVIKHHSQKQLVKERFYLVYGSTPQSIGEGRQDKNLEAGTEGQATEESYWLLLLVV